MLHLNKSLRSVSIRGSLVVQLSTEIKDKFADLESARSQSIHILREIAVAVETVCAREKIVQTTEEKQDLVYSVYKAVFPSDNTNEDFLLQQIITYLYDSEGVTVPSVLRRLVRFLVLYFR